MLCIGDREFDKRSADKMIFDDYSWYMCDVGVGQEGKGRLSTVLLRTLDRWSGHTSITERQQCRPGSSAVAHELPYVACTSRSQSDKVELSTNR